VAKELTLLAHAVRNLRRRPFRSGVLVAAIGLLVCVLVFALSFVTRVESSIRRTSDRLGADLIVVPTGSRGAAEDVLLDNKTKTFFMDRSILERVRKVPGIERATAQTYLATIAGSCCDVPDALVVAFDPAADFVVGPWLQAALGRPLHKGEAIVGAESAFNIALGLTQVDGVLFGNAFRIVGELERTGTGLDTAIFIDEANLADVMRNGKARVRPGQISVVFAKVAPGFDPQAVAGRIEDTIIETDTVARRDVGRGVLDALRDIERMFVVTFALASLLSAGLAWSVFSGVANERAREVAIMRALGAKGSHVTRLFLLEVFLVGAAGSAAGVAAGAGLSAVLVRGFSIVRSATLPLTAGQRLAIAAAGLAIGLGICVVGALAPVRRTRRLEPLLALKGE
jgi:putative ABC transport system permease protein